MQNVVEQVARKQREREQKKKRKEKADRTWRVVGVAGDPLTPTRNHDIRASESYCRKE